MKNQLDTNGKRQGLWKEYYSNGKLWFKGRYKNGIYHGLWEYYHSNGELWHKGNCKRDRPSGLWYDDYK